MAGRKNTKLIIATLATCSQHETNGPVYRDKMTRIYLTKKHGPLEIHGGSASEISLHKEDFAFSCNPLGYVQRKAMAGSVTPKWR